MQRAVDKFIAHIVQQISSGKAPDVPLGQTQDSILERNKCLDFQQTVALNGEVTHTWMVSMRIATFPRFSTNIRLLFSRPSHDLQVQRKNMSQVASKEYHEARSQAHATLPPFHVTVVTVLVSSCCRQARRLLADKDFLKARGKKTKNSDLLSCCWWKKEIR